MSFLELIQNDLCHPENIQWKAGPSFYCEQCHKNVNIYEYIIRPWEENYFRSSELAEAFFKWTGDENVPLNIILVDIQGIFPRVVRGQTLNRVRKGLRLLKALNSPFIATPPQDHCSQEDTETFLIDFLNIIYEHPDAESNRARILLDSLIKAMHSILSSKEIVNPIETYFKVLLPYVQQCQPHWEPLKIKKSFPNLASEVLHHFQVSSAIRQVFGKFSIPFDILHVMVSCYTCSVDMEVVGNWVLDFMARVCRGNYFWKNHPESPFVQKMNQLLLKTMKPTKQAAFCQTLRPIKQGESAEHYSTLLRPFSEVQLFIKKKFCTQNNDTVMEMAFTQTFPTVCFQDHADNLGFIMAYNYLMQTLSQNNGKETKGMYKTAKHLHLAVQKFINKIQEFDSGDSLPWTLDTFKLFLASDEDYEKEIIDTITLLMNDNKDGN